MASSAPKSNTCTMFGCTSRAAASASRRKRDDEAGVLRQVLGQQLDGHAALEPRVHGELHGRHAADAESAFQAVAVCEQGVGGHPSSSGGTPPEPFGSVGPCSPPLPGSTVAVGSGVCVGVGVGVGVSVGVGRRRRRLGRARGRRRRGGLLRLGLALVGHLAVQVFEPVAQVLLEGLVGPAREAGELLLGLAHGLAGPLALARGRGVAGVRHEAGDPVGVALGDELLVVRAAAGEQRTEAGGDEQGAEPHPVQASGCARASPQP